MKLSTLVLLSCYPFSRRHPTFTPLLPHRATVNALALPPGKTTLAACEMQGATNGCQPVMRQKPAAGKSEQSPYGDSVLA